MEDGLYKAVLDYLVNGNEPDQFPSTKSNFLALSRRFNLRNGELTRNAKWVVKKSEREAIFDAFHQHAGR